MKKNPRHYPDTMASSESGRPMTRGEKPVTISVDGQSFTYNQPGWWCSLTDPDDMEGELVDSDNQVREMARRTAEAMAAGEMFFVPILIRAIREQCGLSQREAGMIFGGGAKSFEKYESGEIRPSGPTKRLLKLAMARPDLFRRPAFGQPGLPTMSDDALIRQTLHATAMDRIYAPLFAAKAPARSESV